MYQIIYVSTIGNYVKKFENKIKSFTRSKYTVSTVNGTSAIHLALKVLNINSSPGVILPTLSFIAAGNNLLWSNSSFCRLRKRNTRDRC